MQLKFLKYPIEAITMNITDRCNLNCPLCFLGKTDPAQTKTYLPFRVFSKIVKQLCQFDNYQNIIINLSGGEPLLHPSFDKFLWLGVKQNIKLKIYTNGILINKKKAGQLIKYPPYSIMFSLDGLEKENNRNRGKGCFKKTIEAIKYIKALKDKNSLTRPYLSVNAVVSSMNYANIYQFYKEMRNIGIRIISFSFVMWSNKPIIDAGLNEFDNRYNSNFSFSKLADTLKNIDHKYGILGRRQVNELLRKIDIIKKEANKDNVIVSFYPDLSDKQQYHAWFSNNINKINQCRNVFKQIRLDMQGNVYPACSVPFYLLGNINKASLRAILNGQKAKKLALDIRQNGLFVICQRCCRRPNNSQAI